MYSGDEDTALAMYQRAIELQSSCLEGETSTEALNDVSYSYLNRALVLMRKKDYKAALKDCRAGVDAREALLNTDPNLIEKRRVMLSRAYMMSAIALQEFSSAEKSVEYFDRALALLSPDSRKPDVLYFRSQVCAMKSSLLESIGKIDGAAELLEESIRLREATEINLSIDDLQLASAYRKLAVMHLMRGFVPEALKRFDQALSIVQNLVYGEGEEQAAGFLILVRSWKAVALAEAGEATRARMMISSAVHGMRNLVSQSASNVRNLVFVYRNYGYVEMVLGGLSEASEWFTEARNAFFRRMNDHSSIQDFDLLISIDINRCRILFQQGRYAEIVEASESILPEAEKLISSGRENFMVRAGFSAFQVLLGLALKHRGRADEGERLLREHLSVLEAAYESTGFLIYRNILETAEQDGGQSS